MMSSPRIRRRVRARSRRTSLRATLRAAAAVAGAGAETDSVAVAVAVSGAHLGSGAGLGSIVRQVPVKGTLFLRAVPQVRRAVANDRGRGDQRSAVQPSGCRTAMLNELANGVGSTSVRSTS